jgi:hypothetical protein
MGAMQPKWDINGIQDQEFQEFLFHWLYETTYTKYEVVLAHFDSVTKRQKWPAGGRIYFGAEIVYNLVGFGCQIHLYT